METRQATQAEPAAVAKLHGLELAQPEQQTQDQAAVELVKLAELVDLESS
jgi:hypothetical protein